jgi:hypothetical protein
MKYYIFITVESRGDMYHPSPLGGPCMRNRGRVAMGWVDKHPTHDEIESDGKLHLLLFVCLSGVRFV